ncbi:site-specific DNA-methyltransferase [Rhizobium leguminosarum]|nr:site-specific DNA-methyltransferase [Rhizobium leguminosarum]
MVEHSDTPEDGAAKRTKNTPTSTVGRGKAVTLAKPVDAPLYQDDFVQANFGDSLVCYNTWDSPTCIVSDGAYGVLGFEGDTSDHTGMPEWYEPHIMAWAKRASAQTTLWFWNSEIGWATVHPVLEKYGWRYINANVWDKGIGHIAGNVNTKKIRRFPVVTEVCVQYVYEAKINGQELKHWLLAEWKRTGLPTKLANEACGVADAATRKYLDQGHLWYWMPADAFEKMVAYANERGRPTGRPYFSIDGVKPMSRDEWNATRTHFACPHGVTNVWQRGAVRNAERIKAGGSEGKAVHLNQKPIDLMSRIIEASTNPGDVVWEPFGGLFTASVAAQRLGRRAFCAEIDPTYFHYGVDRLTSEADQRQLL